MSTFGVGGSKAVKGVFILFMFAHLLLFRSDFKPNFNTDSIEEMYLSRRGYSKAYMASLINFAKENPNARGGFVLGPQELLKLNGGRQALTYQRGSHFAYLRNNNNLIPLTLPQTLYAGMDTGSLPYIKSKLGNSILSYYRHMPDTGVLTYTRSYIDKNIDFIVLSPSAKPEDVGLNEKSYFYIKDSLSGEALLSLMK